MHELQHRATKLNSERLEVSTLSLALLPAIIFTEMGDPPTPCARTTTARKRSHPSISAPEEAGAGATVAPATGLPPGGDGGSRAHARLDVPSLQVCCCGD